MYHNGLHEDQKKTGHAQQMRQPMTLPSMTMTYCQQFESGTARQIRG